MADESKLATASHIAQIVGLVPSFICMWAVMAPRPGGLTMSQPLVISFAIALTCFLIAGIFQIVLLIQRRKGASTDAEKEERSTAPIPPEEITEEERQSIAYQNTLIELGRSIEGILDSLQIDALHLAEELLGFAKEVGPPPWPKYSRDQIRGMSMPNARRLIEEDDRDYSLACEFWFGERVDDPPNFRPDVESVVRGQLVRGSVQDPWIDKVRALFAERNFPSRIESVRNRFAIEGLSENDLNVPVGGLEARKAILRIAQELWMLAYKVREKEISLEKDGVPRRL